MNKESSDSPAQVQKALFEFRTTSDGAEVDLGGYWLLTAAGGCSEKDWQTLNALTKGKRLIVRFGQLRALDSRLPAFLSAVEKLAAERGLVLVRQNWPEKVQLLLKPLREATKLDYEETIESDTGNWITRIGCKTLRWWKSLSSLFTFSGEVTIALFRLVTGKSQMRRRDFLAVVYDAGLLALPIVSLISFLVGLIIAFLGAVVLTQFGAEFAVAYLIGYGMLREMGAIMTGVIMSGRTGAAYAAQIGSMKISEELDALETLGIRSMDFVVLPRLMAMSLMVPLLTVYANIVGIFGGFLVAKFLMGVPQSVFFGEMVRVVGIDDFALGLIKGVAFGVIIALSGCLRGLQCGGGADAVGVAATRAVVTSITLIILANAIINWAVATIRI